METRELSHLKNIYELTAMKYLNIKDELLSKRLLLGLATSTVGLASSEDKATFKAAGQEVEKASTAYFAAVQEYRAGLLPKGYKEVEMQSEVTYAELCSDEDFEAGEAAPKASIVAIPEGNKALPYCYKQVSPGSVKGEIEGAAGMLVWDWLGGNWNSWKESYEFCNFTEVARV